MRHTQGEHRGKLWAEIGVIHVQVKEHQGLLATTGSQVGAMDWIPPQSLQREPVLPTPGCALPAYTAVKEASLLSRPLVGVLC